MEFPGPVMRCQESNSTNVTMVNHTAILDLGFTTTKIWSRFSGNLILDDAPTMGTTPCPWRDLARLNATAFNKTYPYETYGADVYYDRADDTFVLQPYRRLECNAAAGNYTLNVTFSNGTQTVRYAVGETRPLVPSNKIPWGLIPSELDYSPLRSMEEQVNAQAQSIHWS